MRKILFFLIAICLAGSAFALSESDIEIITVKDNIMQEESARFAVNIINNESIIKEVKIYSPSVEWTIPTKTIKLYPNKEKSEALEIKPTKYVSPGETYKIPIHLRETDTDELVKKAVFIYVKPPGQAFSNYVASVDTSARIKDEIMPGENVVLTVVVENQNVLVLENLTLRVKSDLKVLNTGEMLRLGPVTGDEGKKILEFTYPISQQQEPGTYTLDHEILRRGEVIAEGEPMQIKVLENTPAYSKEENVTESFLKTRKTIIYTSRSNVEDKKTIMIGSGILARLFTETSVQSKIIEEEGRKHIAFDVELSPGESKEVIIIKNYRILLYAAIIVVFGLLIYYKYKSPLKIVKSVSDVQLKEGGISELKVMLQIKNTSKKKVSNAKVTDYIPNIADVSKEFIEGTLKPSKVLMHDKKGTILKWDLEEISAGEERLISYSLKSKLSIIGNFRLPRAKAGFKKGKKEIYTYSNTLGINA